MFNIFDYMIINMMTEEFTVLDTRNIYKDEIKRIRRKMKFILSQQITAKSSNQYCNNYDIITIHLNSLKERLIYYIVKMDLLDNCQDLLNGTKGAKLP